MGKGFYQGVLEESATKRGLARSVKAGPSWDGLWSGNEYY